MSATETPGTEEKTEKAEPTNPYWLGGIGGLVDPSMSSRAEEWRHGLNARRAGLPRQVPPTLLLIDGKDIHAWYRGWDSLDLDEPTPATAPVPAPPPAEPLTTAFIASGKAALARIRSAFGKKAEAIAPMSVDELYTAVEGVRMEKRQGLVELARAFAAGESVDPERLLDVDVAVFRPLLATVRAVTRLRLRVPVDRVVRLEKARDAALDALETVRAKHAAANEKRRGLMNRRDLYDARLSDERAEYDAERLHAEVSAEFAEASAAERVFTALEGAIAWFLATGRVEMPSPVPAAASALSMREWLENRRLHGAPNDGKAVPITRTTRGILESEWY